MALREQILEDLKKAMLAKDVATRDTLRMVKADFDRVLLDAGGDELSDSDAIAVLSKAVKTRQESVLQYREGGREDLAAKEEAEVAVIQRYLPKPLSADEAKAAIADVIKELGAQSKKDMGRVMKEVNARFRGQIDGKQASQVVASLLS